MSAFQNGVFILVLPIQMGNYEVHSFLALKGFMTVSCASKYISFAALVAIYSTIDNL